MAGPFGTSCGPAASLPAPHNRKPIYTTEFGVRGKRDQPGTEPGVYEPNDGFDRLTAG